MKLEDFKKKNKPKRMSKLSSFKSEIFELHSKNYSLVAIQNFLKSNGVDTTFQNLHHFIKNNKKDSTVVRKNEMEKKDEESQKTQEKESWEPQLKKDNPILKHLNKE